MPGTTPVYGFPYPEPTDLVADYPALGQDLAEDIEAVLPTIGGLAPATPTSIANSGGSASLSGNTVSFTGVTSVSLNGCLTSTYNKFRVMVKLRGVTADGFLALRMRVGGTDATGSNYNTSLGGANVTGAAAIVACTTTYFYVLQTDNGSNGPYYAAAIDLYDPATAYVTAATIVSTGVNSAGNATGLAGGGNHTVSTAYDGLTLLATVGNIDGLVSVYGYKK